MTTDKSLSEDLTQNVFERILRYRNSYQGTGSFKGWMFQIARNVFYDHKGQKKINIAAFVDVNALNFPEKKECCLDDQKNVLKAALDIIPPEYKEVILLTRYEALKYKEVARILNCTENNVKVKVHRALKALKQAYFKLEKTT